MANKENNIRDKKIVRRFCKGESMPALAEEFGVTRQRIEQILKREGVQSRKASQDVYRFTHTCQECRKSFKSKQKNRKYCSVECSHLGRRVYRTDEERKRRDEEKRRKYAERSRHYYHEVFKRNPRWKEIVKERNSRYASAKKTSREV